MRPTNELVLTLAEAYTHGTSTYVAVAEDLSVLIAAGELETTGVVRVFDDDEWVLLRYAGVDEENDRLTDLSMAAPRNESDGADAHEFAIGSSVWGPLAADHINALADEVYAVTMPCNGRLTLASGVPVPTSNLVGKQTLYYTPYNGNKIALYSGTKWQIFSFSEISLDLSGLSANTNYDIFAYDSDGTPAIEALAWSNDSTRATALATQDGIYVKSGAATRRYVGTIRTSGAVARKSGTTSSGSPVVTGMNAAYGYLAPGMLVTGTGIPDGTAIESVDSAAQITLTKNATASGSQTDLVFSWPAGYCEDTPYHRFVWNAYNAVPRMLITQQTSGLVQYATATWREANDGLNQIRGRIVIGLEQGLAGMIGTYFSIYGVTGDETAIISVGVNQNNAYGICPLSVKSSGIRGVQGGSSFRFNAVGFNWITCNEYGTTGAVFDYSQTLAVETQSSRLGAASALLHL